MSNNIKSNIRMPIVSGTFYSDNPDILLYEIDLMFKGKRFDSEEDIPSYKDKYAKKEVDSDAKGSADPDDEDKINKNKSLVAGISPHAGYFFSGRCASSLYKKVKYDTKLIVILGFSHNGFDDDISTTKKHFETPLGTIRSEDRIIQGLIDKGIAKEDDYSLESDHSIETQIPIIQYMMRKGMINQDVKIIPLSVPRTDFKKKAEEIKKILQEDDALEGSVFIASSDFTHYGRGFGYTPFKDDSYDKITALDNGAIDLIKKMKSDDLMEYMDKTKAAICGINPILLLIEIIKLFKSGKGELIEYYKSSDIIEDRSSSVSYASIGFFK